VEENIKVDWVNWLMLISGLIFLAIVGWYGMVLIKSHVFLRSHMDLVNSSLADASTILHEYKSSDTGGVTTASLGVFLGRIGCLLVWSGKSIDCYKPAKNIESLIYFKEELVETSMEKINVMVDKGWVEENAQLATNEQLVGAYLSDPEEVGFLELMHVVRFGDIVGILSNIETNEVESFIMIYRGSGL
jgi:hypothetical protein